GFAQVAVDRGDQPPHPVPIQLILAAQVPQHPRLRHAADTLVVRELDVPHHRAVPIPALRRPQVHAHQQSRNNHGDQARHGKSCAHANPCFPTIRNAPTSANADQKARVCPLTAEVGFGTPRAARQRTICASVCPHYDYVALRSGYPTRRPMQGEPPKCDKRLAAPSGSPRRPADPASPSTSSRELRCATLLLATHGDASNIETPAASASQPIWHFQRSSVPKQLRPDIRSQYSWQVSQSNWRLRRGQQVSAQLASSKQYCAKGNRVESSAGQIVEEPWVTNVKARCGQCCYLVTLWVSPVVGPVRNTSRNLPICTSSPFASTAQSTGSRLTYVPLRLPTSTTWNSPLTHRNSACRRLTVTSSRKILLFG